MVFWQEIDEFAPVVISGEGHFLMASLVVRSCGYVRIRWEVRFWSYSLRSYFLGAEY